MTSRFANTRASTALALPLALGLALVLLSSAVAAAEPPADAAIANAIVERLSGDPGVNSLQVDVDVDQGVASLSGTVSHLLAKQRARRLAGTVKGVRAVINRIEVAAPFRPDDELKAQIEAALATDTATESYEVEVKVDRQRVTLDGWVDSWAERMLAAQVAMGVAGVKRLEGQGGGRPARSGLVLRQQLRRAT
jgi:osmotically-inducible protein OsmY